MEIYLKNEKQMLKYIKNNYLVIFPDKSIKIYKSLRAIEGDIMIHSSSISKKLKDNDYCVCLSKGTNYFFYIRKLT